MKPFSEDLRERVIAAVEETQNIAAVARRFNVGRTTIHSWLASYSERGTLTPLPFTGRNLSISEEHHPELIEQFRANPDARILTHCEMWAEKTGITVSRSTMCRLMKKLGWTIKKKHSRQQKEAKKKGQNSAS